MTMDKVTDILSNVLGKIFASIIVTFILMWAWNHLAKGYQIDYDFWNVLAVWLITGYIRPMFKLGGK
jgi:hypothetical protein